MSLEEWFNTSSVRYIPPGMIPCYITGKLRRDTPEENVRQRIARSLVEEYGYEKEQIKLDFRIYMGRKSYPVDIAIFFENKPHTPENIYIIVETKKESVRSTSKDQGIGQIKSYMRMALNCEFGLWTNGVEKYCFRKARTNGQYKITDIIDIPPKGKSVEDFERLDFSQLRPAVELGSVFRRCHDYIHGNQGLPKDIAFRELLKVIFCKVYDERESRDIRFYVTNKELKSTIGQIKLKERIDDIFHEVRARYSHIFKRDERIELKQGVLAYVISQLQHFSLLLTDTDIKGDAYEAIVGANLKGDRGEFFTPRNVCKMAVECLFYTYPAEKWHTLRAIDPACGTGGFLIAVINLLKRSFFQQELEKWKDKIKAISRAEERVREYCEKFLYGVDFNPLLVRASQMNEVMHGNGSGNLFSENSLLSSGEWSEETRKNLKLGTFDLVFTNPPFGSEIPIDDPHILAQYDLAYKWKRNKKRGFHRTDKLRRSVPPEQLFIERCIQFLHPRGRLAIVLPDSILSNPSLAFIRYWILRKTRVIASIDLPRESFQPYVGTKTSVLFLEKKLNQVITDEEQTGQMIGYDVYMAIAENVGHDKRGNPIYRRTPEGEEVLVETEREFIGVIGKRKFKEIRKISEPIKNDDLPMITSSFKDWWNKRK